MSQQTKRVLAYTVKQGDSLGRLALQYMQDASNWLQLAILNSLDYPFITDDTTLAREVYATGTVTFTRTAGTVGDVVIPGGSTVYVPAGANSPRRDFLTDAVATIPNGSDTIDAPVTGVVFGEANNAPALTVTGLAFTVADLASVRNADPLTGGAVLNVKFPGDTVLVYVDAAGAQATEGVDTKSLQGDNFYDALLGTDIGLDKNGDLQADSRGGLSLVGGLSNLREAISHRLAIPLQWYVYYPFYGTGIETAIGQRGEDYWLQWAAVEAERTVRTDPRVADVRGMTVTYQSGLLKLTFDIVAIGQSNPQNLIINLRPVGGV